MSNKNQKALAKGRTLKATLKTYAKSCASVILRFLRMRRKFTDSLVFGVVVALLLNLVPWIGGLLAGAGSETVVFEAADGSAVKVINRPSKDLSRMALR